MSSAAKSLTSGAGRAADGTRHGLARLLFAAVVAFVAWITLVPLAMLLYATVSAGPNRLPFEATRLTLDNYFRVFADPATLGLIRDTAVFACGATALGVGTAIFFAWLIERTDVWCRQFFFVAILIPMAIPNMIYAMSWIQLLAPNNGLVNTSFQNMGLGFLALDIFSLGGVTFVQGIALASHAYLLVAVPFRMLDPSWEEQSMISGKRNFATLRRITIPVLKPALFAALIFFFVVAMETFDIPVTLGLTAHVHVISTSIYWASHPETGQLPDYGMASTLAMMLLLVALGLIQLYHRQIRNAKQFVTITGRGYRPRRMALGSWRLPLFLLALLYVVVAVGLPLFILVWRSLLRFYMYPSMKAVSLLSLAAFRNVLADAEMPDVLTNTLVVAAGAGMLCVALAAVIAWLVVRGPAPPRWRRRLNSLAFLPQAVPSIVIGLALIFVYLWLPVPIYGTVWIIALAMLTKYLSYSTGAMIAAQMQVSGELEEASQTAGAGLVRTYRRIVLPLIGPALLSCLLWVVIHVVRELGLSLMLYSLHSQVLSTKIWLLWENGRVADASAVGVLTVLTLLLLLALPWALRRLRGLQRYFAMGRGLKGTT